MGKRLDALKLAFFSAFAISFVVSVYLAVTIRLDYFDAYNYLLQARRLTDSDLGFVGFDGVRPRALVAVLIIFDGLSVATTRSLPNLTAYHLLMVIVSMAFIASWVAVGRRVAGRQTGWIVGIWLALCPLFLHYSPMMLADILTGLGWGVTLLLFFEASSQKQRQGLALCLGIAGAFTGTGKHHCLALLPLLLGIFAALDRRKETLRWTALVLGAFAAATQLLLMATSAGASGWPQEISQILSGMRGMKGAAESGYEGYSPLYAEGLWHIFGPLFCGLAVTALPSMVFRWKEATKPILAFVVTSVFYLALTQSFLVREMRYLLPFLPAPLILVAAAMLYVRTRLPEKGLKIAWTTAWVVASIFPAYQSFTEVKVYAEDPVYRTAHEELNRLYRFLGDERCSKLIACLHSLKPGVPFEHPRDEFYRSYDIGPHYTFHLKKPSHFPQCPVRPAELVRGPDFPARLTRGFCYVVRAAEREGAPFLVAFRESGQGWESGEFFRGPEIESYAAK